VSTYRKEWPCCGEVTETEAWEPEDCPFCRGERIEALAKALCEALPFARPPLSQKAFGALIDLRSALRLPIPPKKDNPAT
jgi:hypothetical protein